MPLAAGTRFGLYEITAPIGAGGMGEVYRARDSKLHRDVAIKVLPELFANQPDRVARFEREAQLLASLNHPHIAHIYGIEEAGGVRALVMELVEGRTLGEILAATVPLSEALSIARQIADALQAAHEKGIIHRDLKPGNVMVNAEGEVKVLDFGLGKALEVDVASDAANSPTMTLGATQVGMILGTAAYMAPEQAKGRPADKRSDVWAFGCVLFELLAGQRAFEGDDVSDTLASVLKSEPAWSALPAHLAPAIRLLVQRCLVKDRRDRIADISTATFLLNEPGSLGSIDAAVAPARTVRSIRLSLALAVVAVAIAATIIAMRLLARLAPPSGQSGVAHLTIALPAGDEIDDPAFKPLTVSADGTHVVYAARRNGRAQLYDRPLSSLEPKAIAGTEGAVSPFFSPDGQWVGFFAQGQMKKASITGGSLQVLCSASNGHGGFWATDGNIYFAPTNISGIWKIPASGGTPTVVTRLNRENGEVSHRWPQLLPGNQAVLFTIWTGPGPDERQTVVQSLSNGDRHVLMRGGATARYTNAGYLVYGRLEELIAVPMNLARLEVASTAPTPMPEHVFVEGGEGADYEISDTGQLVYLPSGRQRLAERLVWTDAAGKVEAVPLGERSYEQISISPDGRQAIVQVMEGAVGLWVYDFARSTLTPLKTGSGSSQAPVWTPDGKRIVYRATRKGLRNVFWRAADGTGDEERLLTKENVSQTPHSISPDGKWLVFSEVGEKTGTDLWLLRLDAAGDRKAQPFLATTADEGDGRVSPDGKWIAYYSNESGRPEVYVQPFPGPGPRILISKDGGDEPLWSRNGRELFYLNGDRLMAVTMTSGPTLVAGAPRLVYSGRYRFSPNGSTGYDISPDGRRFLRVQQVEPEQPANQIHVVLNWTEELKQRVGR